ncbi:hypothetical protein ACFQYP_21640 [Nonomuraea antimicrobica]
MIRGTASVLSSFMLPLVNRSTASATRGSGRLISPSAYRRSASRSGTVNSTLPRLVSEPSDSPGRAGSRGASIGIRLVWLPVIFTLTSTGARKRYFRPTSIPSASLPQMASRAVATALPQEREGVESEKLSLDEPASSRSATEFPTPAMKFIDVPQETPALLRPSRILPVTASTTSRTRASPGSAATSAETRVPSRPLGSTTRSWATGRPSSRWAARKCRLRIGQTCTSRWAVRKCRLRIGETCTSMAMTRGRALGSSPRIFFGSRSSRPPSKCSMVASASSFFVTSFAEFFADLPTGPDRRGPPSLGSMSVGMSSRVLTSRRASDVTSPSPRIRPTSRVPPTHMPADPFSFPSSVILTQLTVLPTEEPTVEVRFTAPSGPAVCAIPSSFGSGPSVFLADPRR